jgi:uncharacterized protein (TIGR02266 family)
MEDERRRHARKRISTAVAFHEPGGAPLRGWLFDISRGGCFIASPSLLTFGETLEIELRLPGIYAQIAGTATVVWVREKSEQGLPAGMGIRFNSVAESSLAAIDGLSGTGARLSRPSTIIGIAPAPATSSPSLSPEVALPAPAPEPQMEAEPEPVPPSLAPARPKRTRWIIAGAASVLAATAIAIGVRSKHRQTLVIDAGVVDVVLAEPILDASAADATLDSNVTVLIVDASTPDARVRDGGRDGGKPKTKPKRR